MPENLHTAPGDASTHKDLQRKIGIMERKYDQQFKIVFDAIKQLLEPLRKPKKRIGFFSETALFPVCWMRLLSRL